MTLALLMIALQLKPPEFRPGQTLPKSPDQVAWDAAQHLKRAIEAEQKGPNHGSGPLHAYSLRYVSLHTLPARSVRRKLGGKEGETEAYSPLDEGVKVLLFTVNNLNRKNPPVTLIRVSPDLFALYLDGPGWTDTAWESLASKDVYFRREWIADSTWDYLVNYTYSQHPIMRFDQFNAVATVDPDYSALLGLPKTLDELKAQLGVNEKLLVEANRKKAGVKTDGLTVTRNNRQLEFYQGAFDLWQSLDVKDSKDQRNALTQLDVVSGDKHRFAFDAGESIGQLGNGFVFGYLSDKDGKAASEVPIDIAVDPNFDDHRVRLGRSCIACHVEGIRSFESDLAKLIEPQVIQLRAINPDDANRLAGRYDEPAIQRAIRASQEDFRASVENVIGEAPERVAGQYANAWRVYVDQRVTSHVAALEAGLSDDGLVAVLTPAIDPNLLYLIAAPGRTLARDVWENKFNQVMLLKGKPVVPKDRASLPAVGERSVSVPTRKPDEAPKITLAGNAEQTVNVTIETKEPTTLKGFVKVPGVIVSGLVKPTLKHELAITLSPPFVKVVEVDIDEKRISIPVESKP